MPTLIPLRLVYDSLYQAASEVFKSNPCEARIEDGKFKCLDDSGCCHGCPHLSPSGCTVEALGCRLWTCSRLQREKPEVEEALLKIRCQCPPPLNKSYGNLMFRASKEEVAKRLGPKMDHLVEVPFAGSRYGLHCEAPQPSPTP